MISVACFAPVIYMTPFVALHMEVQVTWLVFMPRKDYPAMLAKRVKGHGNWNSTRATNDNVVRDSIVTILI